MYWKRPKRRNRCGARGATFFSACTVILLTAVFATAFDKLGDLQEHFDKDTHAASKVKDLDRLTDAQFEVARKASSDGNFVAAGLVFEKYRDNVRACFDLLRKQEPDADKHSGSYRHLELQVRRGIREVEDTLLTAPLAMRPPLELVHKDLLDVDDQLIRLLFPRQTAASPSTPPSLEDQP
jgi:hypothetical protein